MREYYSVVYQDVTSAGLLRILDNTQASEVVILSELEWELPGATPEVTQAYKDKNVKLTVVLGSFDTEINNCEVIHWPTFWINWTYENLKWINEPEFDINQVKYPFISLNNRSHFHRCMFIEEMAKHNLIDKGVVTWVKHLNENPNFYYRYFDNRQILLDDNFVTELNSFLIPKEYNKSLFHVITEATSKSKFITEKTMIPTFFKKPYIVLGGIGFNRQLQDLGFKLYDEVFDYEFDDEYDLYNRNVMFVKNVKRIMEMNLYEVYKQLLPKIIHNYNHALSIVNNPKFFIPDIIKDCLRDTNDIGHNVFGRYHRFLDV